MSVAPLPPKVVKQAIHWMLKLRESGHNARLQLQCEQWRSEHHEHELAWQRVLDLHQELNLRAIPGAGVALQTLETSERRLHRRQALKLKGPSHDSRPADQRPRRPAARPPIPAG
ncbi:MAG: FecR/PupR family sigma factor regulator, partial [Gammaproteobacteria bacterium]